jgi:excisionase family DNA binding protein
VTRNSIPPTASNRLPRLYTVRDTAVYAQTSQKTVRRWLMSGVLPFHRLGRNIRIAEADLLAFLADRRQGWPEVSTGVHLADRATCLSLLLQIVHGVALYIDVITILY